MLEELLNSVQTLTGGKKPAKKPAAKKPAAKKPSKKGMKKGGCDTCGKLS